MENSDDARTEDLPDDLTPFITRTTLDPVGGGGYGDVWKCNFNHEANGISAFVAVKAFKLSERYDLETINRKISREIGILKILDHNNIVPLWGIATGFGRMSELRCLVSPWMPNGTLNAYLSNHNDLTVLDRSRMLEDVSAGLRYLHSIPVMHGDITGANILIDKGGHARLIDFGLSTITQPLLGQSHLAATSIRPGAIRYAAPELVLSEDVRALGLVEKTDIYSFGCVMLQILSGRPPWFEIQSERLAFRIVVMISEGRGPQRPDGHPEIVDSDWNFIQKCLQSGPELRPSAEKVLEFVTHRLSSPDSCSRPPDDPSDDTPDGFPGALPFHNYFGSYTAEQPYDSLPLPTFHSSPFDSPPLPTFYSSPFDSPPLPTFHSSPFPFDDELKTLVTVADHSPASTPSTPAFSVPTFSYSDSGGFFTTPGLVSYQLAPDDLIGRAASQVHHPMLPFLSSTIQPVLPSVFSSTTAAFPSSVPSSFLEGGATSSKIPSADRQASYHSEGGIQSAHGHQVQQPGCPRTYTVDGLSIDEGDLIDGNTGDGLINVHACGREDTPCGLWVKADRDSIKRHGERWHNDRYSTNKRIVCPWSGCNRQMQARSVSCHIFKVHFGVRWICEGCSKVFTEVYTIRTHACEHGYLEATARYDANTRVVNAKNVLSHYGLRDPSAETSL